MISARSVCGGPIAKAGRRILPFACGAVMLVCATAVNSASAADKPAALSKMTGYWERAAPFPGGGAGPPGAGPPGAGPPGAGGAGPPGAGQPPGASATNKIGALEEPGRFPPALIAVLQPWALKALEDYKNQIRAGIEPPTPENSCLPFAIPGERIAYGFPFALVVQSNAVLFVFNADHQFRVIHMNASHPPALEPSWYGHSVGRWEGDTLVVDTIGFNDRTQLADGTPHSTQLHSLERYRLTADGTKLEATYRYDDPGSLTAPYEFAKTFKRAEPMQEYVTAQNNFSYQCPENKNWKEGVLSPRRPAVGAP